MGLGVRKKNERRTERKEVETEEQNMGWFFENLGWIDGESDRDKR